MIPISPIEYIRQELENARREVWNIGAENDFLRAQVTSRDERITELENKLRELEDRLDNSMWMCNCGVVNGGNLPVCRVCGRKDGDI